MPAVASLSDAAAAIRSAASSVCARGFSQNTCDRGLGVEVVRPEVVEDVDLLDDVRPVGRVALEAQLVDGLGECRLVPSHQHVAFDRRSVREEHRQSGECVRVRLSHEPVADEAY